MEWIAGVLALVVVVLIAVYRKACRECRQLASYSLLILLDEQVHASQRAGLATLVHSIDAKNAVDLGGRVYISLVQLAERLGSNLLDVSGLLWKLKNTPVHR